jgi:hypothetical protein
MSADFPGKQQAVDEVEPHPEVLSILRVWCVSNVLK